MADLDRCTAAGIPADLPFATKPQLARQMIGAALDTGIRVGWVTADEAYGLDPSLQDRGVGYVLAVARNHRVQLTTHLRERSTRPALSEQAWQRRRRRFAPRTSPGSRQPVPTQSL
jgi:SRSO17 transposase